MELYYRYLFFAALVCLGIGLLLALLRAIKGPRIADRIMGINMLGTLSSAILAVLSLYLRQSWLLDVCLIYCMISFLAVVVLAKNQIAELGHEEDERHE